MVKKMYSILTVAALCFSISACGGTDAGSKVDNSKTNTSQRQAKTQEKTKKQKVKNAVTNEGNASIRSFFPNVTGNYVVEFFWLACPHCQDAEKDVVAEQKLHPDVKLIRVPATFNKRWKLDASIYYAAMQMNMKFEPLMGFYKKIRVQKDAFPTQEELNNYVQSRGKSVFKFDSLIQSKTVKEKVEKADEMVQVMNIEGTPTFVVNGDHIVSTEGVNSYKELLQKVYANFQ